MRHTLGIYAERISRTGPRMRGTARKGSGQMTTKTEEKMNEAKPASGGRHLDGPQYRDMGRSFYE